MNKEHWANVWTLVGVGATILWLLIMLGMDFAYRCRLSYIKEHRLLEQSADYCPPVDPQLSPCPPQVKLTISPPSN